MPSTSGPFFGEWASATTIISLLASVLPSCFAKPAPPGMSFARISAACSAGISFEAPRSFWQAAATAMSAPAMASTPTDSSIWTPLWLNTPYDDAP